jgi:hypothetical protein
MIALGIQIRSSQYFMLGTACCVHCKANASATEAASKSINAPIMVSSFVQSILQILDLLLQ